MAQALQLGSPTKITLNATSCWHDLARVEGYEEGMKSKLSKTPKVCGFKWFILKLCPKVPQNPQKSFRFKSKNYRNVKLCQSVREVWEKGYHEVQNAKFAGTKKCLKCAAESLERLLGLLGIPGYLQNIC